METKINLDDVTEIKVDLNNLTEEEIEKLLSLIEKAKKPKSKVWKPEEGQLYWLITGTVTCYNWDGSQTDHNLFSIGNCFKTKEEAENAAERLKIRAELQRYADEHNDKEIDWGNYNQTKYFFNYDNFENEIRILCTINSREPFQIYFTSRNIAKDAVKAVGEERIKKYLFGVEE